jgi:ElaB/YqjD/DUF883 family membrane-anchored ribosome-binding protein
MQDLDRARTTPDANASCSKGVRGPPHSWTSDFRIQPDAYEPDLEPNGGPRLVPEQVPPDRDKPMNPSAVKSVDQLREESERTRQALASTVTELRDRVGDSATEIKTIVSPSHIKQEIRDYVRRESESLVETVQRKAKENPLQMAAIAAAVAYPALGLLRALPTPLWLIGAGLFLTSKRGRQAAEDLKTQVEDVVQQGTEKAADLAGAVRSDVENRVAGARYGLEEVRDTVTSTVGGLADKARTVFHDARDAAAGLVEDGTKKATVAADHIGTAFSQTTSSMKEGAGEMARTSRNSVTDFINDNPLLVAGIGAAVGAIIAASIPPSEAENRLFGAGSEKLKEKAREAAAEGIDKVGDLAAETAGSVAAAAAREGLDATGVQNALNKVADGVRAVADRGVDTALGNQKQPQPNEAFEYPAAERNQQ